VWSRAANVFYECETLASLTHTYLGSFFLDPEDIISQSLGAVWNLSKGMGFHDLASHYRAQSACQKGVHALGPKGLEPIYYSVLFYYMDTVLPRTV
jgi:hypothetical protein